ncbi:MAG: T9SS type A sorting domain-containing protein [Nonlabens sp.]
MKNTLSLLLLSLGLLASLSLGAQTTIYTQNFETANSGYTASNTGGSGSTDVFNRTDPNIGGNTSFIWAAEDIDDVVAPFGETLTLSTIDVTGLNSFTFSVDLLTTNLNDWDGNTEVLINYSLDGGVTTPLLHIQSTANASNEPAAIDTDFNGIGECSAATVLPALSRPTVTSNGCLALAQAAGGNFQNFSSQAIALAGNSALDIVITFNNVVQNDVGLYMDNITVTTPMVAPADTVLSINPSDVVVNEGDGTASVTVGITNPDATNATTVDLVLTTGDAVDVGNFTTQTITFPAGSSVNQIVNITITDDTDIESTETFAFELQNATGGNNATIGNDDLFELDIIDNDSMANAAPVITAVSDNSAGTVNQNRSVDVNATVTDDNNNVQTVTLNYSFTATSGPSGNESGSEPLTRVGVNSTNYTGTIPGFQEAGTVEYVIFASDESANVGNSTAQTYTVIAPGVTPLPIIINEVSQGSSGNKDWVELLVVQDGLDLTGYELGDNDDGGVFDSYITFDNIPAWQSVAAGTLIVIYNGNDVDSTIVPDLTFGNVGAQVDYDAVIASTNTFYFSGGWGRFSDSDRDDGPVLFDSNSVLIHDMVVTHPTAAVPTPLQGNARAFLSDQPTTAALSNNANWTATNTLSAFNASPADGNGGINSIYINSLRGRTTYVYDGMNWTPTTPFNGNSSSQDIVRIEAGTVTATSSLDALDLFIEDAATFDLSTFVLNINGDLEEVGTGAFIADQGTLNFAGNKRQFITGNDFTAERVILNNNSGLVLNVNLDIEGFLRIDNGVLTIGDDILTFKSGLEGGQPKTAVLDAVTNGGINGSVKIEQFFPSSRAFRFVGSPLEMTGSIFTNWQQSGREPGDVNYLPNVGTDITGGTGPFTFGPQMNVSQAGFDPSGSNDPSAFVWNAATQTFDAITGTRLAANTAANLEAGDAVNLLIRGDRSVSLTDPNASSTTTTLITSGTLSIGDFEFPTVSTPLADGAGEYSLIGNPYLAQVNMGQVLNDTETTNIDDTFYYAWDPRVGTTTRPPGSRTASGNGQYVLYSFVNNGNNVLGSEVNQFIQPSQAIFVETENNGPATLKFRENFKSDSPFTTAIYRAPSDMTSIFINMFVDNELSTGVARDGMILNFSATHDNAIGRGDALKFNNFGENIASTISNQNYAMLSNNLPADNEIIDLFISNIAETSYTFKIDNEFDSSRFVYLVDGFTNETILLSTGENLIQRRFDLGESGSIAGDRFSLLFQNTTLGIGGEGELTGISVFPNPVVDTVTLSGLRGGLPLSTEVTNLNGQMLFETSKKASSNLETIEGFDNLPKGLYLLTIKEGNQTTTLKIAKK